MYKKQAILLKVNSLLALYCIMLPFFLLQAACVSGTTNEHKKGHSNPTNATIQNDSLTDLFKSLGVATVLFEKGSALTLYNQDGSTYAIISLDESKIQFTEPDYSVSFYSVEREKSKIKSQYGLAPRVFSPEYELVLFEIIKIDGNKVFVYINDAKKEIKYLLKGGQVNIEDWPTHLNNKLLSLDDLSNPIKERPEDNSKSIVPIDPESIVDIVFKIVEVKGEWLGLRCDEVCGSGCTEEFENKTVWIRLAKDGKILLNWGYIC